MEKREGGREGGASRSAYLLVVDQVVFHVIVVMRDCRIESW
jgi:hypothetical protein